jgi:hypothetical protein
MKLLCLMTSVMARASVASHTRRRNITPVMMGGVYLKCHFNDKSEMEPICLTGPGVQREESTKARTNAAISSAAVSNAK